MIMTSTKAPSIKLTHAMSAAETIAFSSGAAVSSSNPRDVRRADPVVVLFEKVCVGVTVMVVGTGVGVTAYPLNGEE